jgi:hypothetical protein
MEPLASGNPRNWAPFTLLGGTQCRETEAHPSPFEELVEAALESL